MTLEEQRIAIGEACGWKNIYGSGKIINYMWAPGHISQVQAQWQNKDCFNVQLPDYLNDLNSMHEAEMWLRLHDISLFCIYISHLVEHADNEGCCASAIQRAEAFLKTVGKWK